ncbi:MAG TPA: CbiX/SirB N-terminal domain-containing protein [Pontiella sp.]
MRALLVIAHGSRRKESNQEIHHLANRLRENAKPAFDLISSAFLEISTPQVASAVSDLVNRGSTEIKVFPYFLTAGTHVVKDIPKLIENEQTTHPQIKFEILPHLGALEGISNLILNQIYPTPPQR